MSPACTNGDKLSLERARCRIWCHHLMMSPACTSGDKLSPWFMWHAEPLLHLPHKSINIWWHFSICPPKLWQLSNVIFVLQNYHHLRSVGDMSSPTCIWLQILSYGVCISIFVVMIIVIPGLAAVLVGVHIESAWGNTQVYYPIIYGGMGLAH